MQVYMIYRNTEVQNLIPIHVSLIIFFFAFDFFSTKYISPLRIEARTLFGLLPPLPRHYTSMFIRQTSEHLHLFNARLLSFAVFTLPYKTDEVALCICRFVRKISPTASNMRDLTKNWFFIFAWTGVGKYCLD